MSGFRVFLAVLLMALLVQPVWAEPELDGLAEELSEAVRGIIEEIVDFLTPIATVICVGMVIVGALLIALRQEFYGIRLIIGGGVGLAIIYLVIPLMLGYL